MRAVVLNSLASAIGILFALVVVEFTIPFFISLRDVGPSFTIYDPEFGKRIKPNISVMRAAPEFRFRLTTNSLGARGPEPEYPLHNSILFLGDSFTMGYGVSDGEEYPALVRAELRRRHGNLAPPVVNLGIGGSGNGVWIKQIRKTAPALSPRVVIMQVLDNDFDDNLHERLFELDDSGWLVELSIPAPSWGRRTQSLIEAVPWLSNTNLVGLLRQAMAPRFPSITPSNTKPAERPAFSTQPEPGDQLTLKILAMAIELCNAHGWQVLGLLVGLQHGHLEQTKGVFVDANAPFLVLPPREERPDLYYAIDGHWNALGHVEAARQVISKLDELRLLAD